MSERVKTPLDSAVVARAWEDYGDWVRQLCNRLMRGAPADDADEAFARTWERLSASLPQTDIHNTRAWIRTIAQNTCVQLRRERTRRREEPIEHDSSAPVMMLAASGTPECDYLTRELANVVADAITALPDRLSRAFCAYLDTRSYQQLACDLGITEVNARKRIQEARAILRGALYEYRTNARVRSRVVRAPACPLLAEFLQQPTPPSRHE